MNLVYECKIVFYNYMYLRWCLLVELDVVMVYHMSVDSYKDVGFPIGEEHKWWSVIC